MAKDPDKTVSTVPKQLTPWEPGQSGNPAGRPKGSRNKLGEAFVEALHTDFLKNGVAAIEKVRAEKPDAYLKVIASILPKELHVTESSLDEMTDNELIGLLGAVRSLVAAGGGEKAPKRGRAAAAKAGATEKLN